MTETRPRQDKQLEERNDSRRGHHDHAPDLKKEDAMFVLFAPGKKDGARVTVRNLGECTSAAEPIRKGVKPGMLFVQTDVSVPVGTVVTLAMPGAYDVTEQQAIQGAVSFVCPAADQFGNLSGLGIQVADGPPEK